MLTLTDHCSIFYSLAQSANPFSQGVQTFKNQLKSFLPQARNLISDQQTTANLAKLIANYKTEQGKTATPDQKAQNAFNTANKNFIMLEDYFIKWLSWLQQNNPAKFNQSFQPNLIQVLQTMADDYSAALNNNMNNYKPFTLLIDNQNAPVDLDMLATNERESKDIF